MDLEDEGMYVTTGDQVWATHGAKVEKAWEIEKWWLEENQVRMQDLCQMLRYWDLHGKRICSSLPSILTDQLYIEYAPEGNVTIYRKEVS